MPYASLQRIKSVEYHNNADSLDVARVLGYKAIVKRDQYKTDDLIVFIEPDTVLPDVPWTAFYRAKSNRVKAIRLRGVWSMGIIESVANVGYDGPLTEGLDISEILGVTKYDPPAPQDLNVSGPYGFGIPKTDEERYQGLESLPYGELCDVTLKIDGQSWSALYRQHTDIAMDGADSSIENIEDKAIGGRSFLYKLDCDNNYTRNERKYQVLDRLSAFCRERGTSLCIRAESYGNGIQKGVHNPHSRHPLDLAFYSTWLIDERRYARKGDPFYIFDIAPLMGLPTVPVLEKDVILTPELIAKYDEGIETIAGQPFEGVVINWSGGSFKIINKAYDAKKA